MDSQNNKKDEKKNSISKEANHLNKLRDNRDGLPRRFRSRLHGLFDQIEEEFGDLYEENMELKNTILKLNKKLSYIDSQTSDRSDHVDCVENVKAMKGKSGLSSSQLSQRLKTTYKTGTSKLVSSFKPNANVCCRVAQEFKGHRDGIWDVASSSLDPEIMGTASADHTAKLWSLATGECIGTYHGHKGSVNCIRFHPEKNLALTAGGDSTVHLWKFEVNSKAEDNHVESNTESPTQQSSEFLVPISCTIAHQQPVVGCDWLMDGLHYVTASWDRTSCLIDSMTSQTVLTLNGHDLPLTFVSAHPKHKLIVTSSRDSMFRVSDFRVPTVHTVIVGQGHSQSVSSAVFTNDDKIVSGSDDRCVKVWDLKHMRTPLASIRFDSAVNRVSVSKKGVIIIPHDNRQVRLYDTNGNRLARLPRNDRISHRRVVTAGAWVEGNTPSILTCGWDNLVIHWNVNLNSMQK